jgi:hypothetical protein
MKSIASYLAAIVVFVAIGIALLMTASFEGDMANAQQQLSTMQFGKAKASLDRAAADARYASAIPSIGSAAQTEIRLRQASLDYWQRRYDAVIPREGDPIGAIEPDNVGLQLVVADAAYRAGQANGGDKASTLQSLDEAIANYVSVLKNDTWDEDAAYNYEYLVRLRDDIAKGRKKSAEQATSAQLGMPGAPAKAANTKAFKVYVPLQGDERTDAAQAGKGGPLKRKG